MRMVFIRPHRRQDNHRGAFFHQKPYITDPVFRHVLVVILIVNLVVNRIIAGFGVIRRGGEIAFSRACPVADRGMYAAVR